MSDLVVRLYDVLFGDGILVLVPDLDPATGVETTRSILIDVGNAPTGEGADNAALPPVVAHVLDTLNGRPLDLYVMTHEHMDHVQGLLVANKKPPNEGRVVQRLNAQYAWYTASAHPDYYATHPQSKKELELRLEAYAEIGRRLGFLPAAERARWASILANNSPSSTKDCVTFLRGLCPAARQSWIYRGMPAAGLKHPFTEASFRVWAPEEDTSVYYGTLHAMAGGPEEGVDGAVVAAAAPREPLPPQGVDAGAFHRLVERRASGLVDNLLAIDRAANNTSVVFSLEWRGWRLLFSGDAEIKSWKVMQGAGALEPVHFLKVSHHGSHNGTPSGDVFDAILPATPPDARERRAWISSHVNTYSGIPDDATNARLASRADVRSTNDLPPGQLYLEAVFPG